MKRFLSGAFGIVLALSTLAGCTGTNVPSPGTQTNEGSKEKTVITMIQNKVEIQEQLEAAAEEYNQSQDGVEVQILGAAGDNLTTVLQSQFASTPEKAPTIFTTGSGTEFERFFDYMTPLDSSKAGKQIAEGLADDTVKDGVLYGLPVAIEGFGLIYNKELFEEAGVKAEDIKTMDDLVAASEKLEQVEGVEHAIAFAKESYFRFMHFFNWPFATMNNAKEVIDQINNGEITLNDISEVKAFVEELDKIKPYTNLSKDSYDEQVAGFATGQYAMIHQGNWAQPIIDDYEVDFDYGMLPVPFKGNDSLSVGNTNFFRVNKYASEAQQEAAIGFLDWLFTEEAGQRYVMEEFKLIPAYKGFNVEKLDPLSKEVSTYAQEGKTIPWVFNYFPAGAHQDFADQMEKYYDDQLTSEQLLEELNKVWMNATK